MKKFIFSIAIFSTAQLPAQTLFSYGKKVVTKQEFLTAFNRNPSQGEDKKQALEEYKNLYVNFKLKVQNALDNKLNEQPSFINESTSFKKQIAESIINEEADAKKLLEEAFVRSQKDIDLSQIFIAFDKDNIASALQSITKAHNDLKAGKNFEEVLNTYCNDESIKATKGNIGFVTVFTLPYEIENIIFNLKQGQFSAPYKSAYGYHIFKNINERTAVGKRRVAQILLAYPKDATEEERKQVQAKADEAHKKALRGENFAMLVSEYSNDYATSNNKGDMGEIGLGKFNKDFEEKIFSLKKEGDISDQINTAFGIHILKLLEVYPVPKTLEDINYAATLKTKLDNSDRLAIAKKNLLSKWKLATGFKKAFVNPTTLFGYTDSIIMDKPTENYLGIVSDSTLLFSFKKQAIKVADFIEYVKSERFSGSENGVKPYEDLIVSYEDFCIAEYYKSHIDDFNKSAQQQIKDFDEANLLFAAMDKNVWSKASTDSLGLKDYYKQNLGKYNWQPGVSAIVISANSLVLANEIHEKITNNPRNWKEIVTAEGAKATSDSSRYEFEQMPIKSNYEKREGFISKPEKVGSDETFSFIYITKVFNQTTSRSFDEARGLVMNDYQQILEQNWIKDLKKKYPIVFKEEVWKTIK
jgi:peptidyl-prolyl cis-trans isomerase SurA